MPSFHAVAFGRVRLRVTGAHIERVINEAARRDIILRNVRREGSKAMTCALSYDDFFRMRLVFRELHCHVRILSRSGLPYLRTRLRARAVFAVGAVACLIVLLAMTQLVWGLRVIGADAYDEEALFRALESGGVHIGMHRETLDSDALDLALRGAFDDISLVTARMRGLTLEVEIVRAEPGPVIFERDTPVDIVASCDGVIERVLALEGTAIVQPGQRVRKGDVLIRGAAIAPGGEIQVHALGEVLARVWVEGAGDAPDTLERSRLTGNYRNRTLFWLLGNWFPAQEEPPYEHYEIAARETEILPGLYIPAGMRRETVYEIDVTSEPRDPAQAQAEAEQAAVQDALAKIPQGTAVVDKWVEYDKIKVDRLDARVGLLTIQEIGEERAR